MTYCAREDELRIITDELPRFILQKIFPVQFTLGVFGNSLIFWVLTSDESTNIASDLLAAVSVCDVMFFFMMLPHSLASFDGLARLYHFRFFYIKTKQHMAAIANWMSAAAIWLILAVSLERFLIVQSPLRSKLYWERSRLAVVLGTVFVITGILTVYHHFEYDCQTVLSCNGTQIFDICFPVIIKHPVKLGSRQEIAAPLAVEMYIRGSTFFNAFLVVFVPMLIVVALNVCLIAALHSSSHSLDHSLLTTATSHAQQKARRRVTVTVVLIGLCFAFTQGPSAVLVIWELVAGFKVPSYFYEMTSVANSLVATGKTLNFVLFCLSSDHFRQKCLRTFTRTFPTLSRSVSRFSRTARADEASVRGGSLRSTRTPHHARQTSLLSIPQTAR